MQHPVGPVAELRREGCRVVEVEGRYVAVVSVGERFYALHDRCPHRGASMSQGTVDGTFVAAAPQEFVYGQHDEVIRCPWHGWEFSLDSGRSLLQPDRVGVKVYRVTVDDDMVVVHT